MDGIELIMQRRSSGQLTEPAPTGEALQQILQAALTVPDHGALHPWQLLLAEGEGRQRLGELLAGAAERFGEKPEQIDKARTAPLRAPLVITVVAKVVVHPKVPAMEQELSAGCAVYAMQLAAEQLGFGSIWRSGPYMFDRHLHRALGLAEQDQIVGFLYLGTAASEMTTVRRPALEGFVRYL